VSEVSIHVLATNKGGAGQERGCKCKLRHEVGGYEDQKGHRIVGWVTCEIKDKESEWNKVTYMLAKYVEYANVGGNKTRGYGVTRLIQSFHKDNAKINSQGE